MCVNCVKKRSTILANVQRSGDKNLVYNLHNVPENKGVKSENSILVRVFDDAVPDKHIILSLML